MDKIIGKYKVNLETILDPEGEIIYHKVKSPMFNGNILKVMNESDITEDVIKNHIQTIHNDYQLDEWYPDSHI
jgi:hypothetical protein